MEYKHNPLPLSELKQNRVQVKVTRKEAEVFFSTLERFALIVTRAVGTMGFFFILTFWTVGWLLWNLWAPIELRFDPAPAFVIWLFASNVIQLILLPLVMVGQNLEGKFAEQRAQADYEINKKSEQEVEVIIAHLENQNELLLELARKIDRK
ncbi:MAG: DUF1003 domain-containing protein [Candidatus Zambryskibacteria bacterium]|nr:DUF1003 domain-containing protein [Candidatus Zambryskibacteria bacterium]